MAAVDARLMDPSQENLVVAMKSITLKKDEIPLRPGFGTSGKPIMLRANFFPVQFGRGPWYEYEVSISPDPKTMKRVKRRIFQLAEASADWRSLGLTRTVAHDHSSKLISARLLPQPLAIRVPWIEEDEAVPKAGAKEYVFTVEYARNIDPTDLHKFVSLLFPFSCNLFYVTSDMCMVTHNIANMMSRLLYLRSMLFWPHTPTVLRATVS